MAQECFPGILQSPCQIWCSTRLLFILFRFFFHYYSQSRNRERFLFLFFDESPAVPIIIFCKYSFKRRRKKKKAMSLFIFYVPVDFWNLFFLVRARDAWLAIIWCVFFFLQREERILSYRVWFTSYKCIYIACAGIWRDQSVLLGLSLSGLQVPQGDKWWHCSSLSEGKKKTIRIIIYAGRGWTLQLEKPVRTW